MTKLGLFQKCNFEFWSLMKKKKINQCDSPHQLNDREKSHVILIVAENNLENSISIHISKKQTLQGLQGTFLNLIKNIYKTTFDECHT